MSLIGRISTDDSRVHAAQPGRPGLVRLWSVGLLLSFGSMLGIGMYLTPNAATHTELGLPPCGFYARYGFPCPTCGYTTAVAQVAHGQWIAAIMTQPAGAALGILGVTAVILGMAGLLTGRWYGPSAFWIGWHWKKFLMVILVLILSAWGYKIMVTGAGLHQLW